MEFQELLINFRRMDFNTLNEAKDFLVESIVMQHKATEQGDSKTANNYSKKIIAVTEYIKDIYGLEETKDLLDHHNEKVRVWIAKSLLPIYEEISILVLKEIGEKNIPHCSFNARIILSEWLNEPL